MKPGRILVSFDALLDTRIAVLAHHYPEVATKVAGDLEYWKRERDDFTRWGGPDQATFKKLYAERTADQIVGALRTSMVFIVKDLTYKLEQQFERSPSLSDYGMDVNIWPYDFTDEEKEAIQRIMMVYGGINTVPEIVSIPDKEITFPVIKERYSGVILYNLTDWLQHHIGQIRSMYINDVTIMAAELLEGEKPTIQELRESGFRDDVNILEMAAAHLREFFVLDYYPVAAYSMHHPRLFRLMFDVTGTPAPPAEKSHEAQKIKIG